MDVRPQWLTGVTAVASRLGDVYMRLLYYNILYYNILYYNILCYNILYYTADGQFRYMTTLNQGVDPWDGVVIPWKYVGGVRVCFDLPHPKMSHSFIQNCCWITLQVSQHQGRKTCQKWNKTNFSTRLQAVRNRDCWVFGYRWRRV